MLHQGKLQDWDPVTGMGFVKQDKAGPAIRISSSGFRKTPETLQNGDTIFFQIDIDAQDQPKAVLAYKAGQHSAPTSVVLKPALPLLPLQHVLSAVVTVFIIAWLGYQSLYLFNAEAALPQDLPQQQIEHQPEPGDAEQPLWPPIPTRSVSQFSCEGKQRCPQMQSCEEAVFYLQNCPDVAIDGDHDGIPCEQQWCG
jgi:cold shock CspA family protein